MPDGSGNQQSVAGAFEVHASENVNQIIVLFGEKVENLTGIILDVSPEDARNLKALLSGKEIDLNKFSDATIDIEGTVNAGATTYYDLPTVMNVAVSSYNAASQNASDTANQIAPHLGEEQIDNATKLEYLDQDYNEIQNWEMLHRRLKGFVDRAQQDEYAQYNVPSELINRAHKALAHLENTGAITQKLADIYMNEAKPVGPGAGNEKPINFDNYRLSPQLSPTGPTGATDYTP